MKLVTLILVTLVVKAYFCSSQPDNNGKTNSRALDSLVNKRILGGCTAHSNEYPYYVALVEMNTIYPFCGGSIIDENWVLTAAHCVEEYINDPKKVQVIVGTQTDLENADQTRPFTLTASRIIFHGKYEFHEEDKKTPFTVINDIALVQVSGSLIINKGGVYSSKIQMAKEEENLTGKTATVTGYGQVTTEIEESRILMTTDLKISPKKCQIWVTFDKASNICAGRPGRGTWEGDSGSPLVVNREGKPILEGVTLFGNPGYGYQVYARVSHYWDWINRSMQSKSFIQSLSSYFLN